MSIATVIAALTERLGPPDTTGEFKGHPTASWGRTKGYGPGVDCYVHGDGTTRVDLYSPKQPMFVIAECAIEPGRPEGFVGRTSLNSVEVFDAHDGTLWPIIVPLDVAVAVAARAMPVPVTDAERERFREQGRVAARNIAANVYREADNTHAAQLLHFEAWAKAEYGAERGAAAVAAFRDGLYGEGV